MADGNEKQIIEIEYVVRADTAIANAEKMQSSINAIKVDIQQLAASSEASFANIAAGMKKAFSEDVSSKIKDIKKNLALATATEVDPFKLAMAKGTARDEIKELLAARREYNEYVTKALAQINAAEVQYSKESIARERDKTNQKKTLLKEEKAAFDEYVRAQKTGSVMTPAAQAMGQEIQKLKSEIATLASQNNKSFNQIGQDIVNKGEQPVKKVTQAIRELNAETQKVSKGGILGFFQSLGTVGQFVFGSVLGMTAITAIRNLVRGFQELIKEGFEYAKALARLEISTNILQEKGYNITLQETLDLVKQLNKEFPIFTRKQVVEGVGYIQLLSQNLTLTNEQMKNLAEVAGGLGVVLGKDVNEASKELALFLSSGYGEALQRAGILASKAAVMHELLAMGIKTSYNETSAAVRAQAGYNVIMRDATALMEKAKEIQKEDAYAATAASNAWTDLKNTIAVRLVPALATLYRVSIFITKAIGELFTAYGKFIVIPLTVTEQLTDSINSLYSLLSKKIDMTSLKEFGKEITNIWSNAGFEEAKRKAEKFVFPDIFSDAKDSAIGAGSAIEDEAEVIGNAVADLYDSITDAQNNFIADSENLWTDYLRDLDQLETDATRKRAESWIDYYADAYEIARKMNDNMEGEEIKFQLDLAQINRDFANKRADAEQKYRDKEQKAEKDFQEKLRRLREEFLFDLEDALRERDARQVLRLIRRFNLEQARLERERDSEREDRQREYRRELDDIERQKAERLQKLQEEHQARMLEIKRQEAIELRELEIKHKAELAEIDRRLQQEKEDRLNRYNQQKEDLKNQFEERIKQIGEELVKEYGVTKEMLDAIGAAYTSTYGPNGVVQRALDYAIGYMAQAMITMSSIASGFGGYGAPPPTGNYGEGFGGIPSYATGAQNMMVTSPQIIQVGEIPEMINITPLNRMGSDMGSKDGTIAIELWLSPDLQARVMDNTLDAVASIMLEQQRRR